MKFWFDADNAPHVLIMKPLAEELARRGHSVSFSGRNRSGTCGLLDYHGIPHVVVGGEYPSGMLGKVFGTLSRSLQLRKMLKAGTPDITFGHGSRSLPLASKLASIPSVTMYDYEWVNPVLFNKYCDSILLPEAITPERAIQAGIKLDKVRFFNGFKEELYLNDASPSTGIEAMLGLSATAFKILLRPPASNAHYHNPKADEILVSLLDYFSKRSDVQIAYLPRTEEQKDLVKLFSSDQIAIPSNPFNGPDLILHMNAVIGGGGTITREAAILGIPSFSFFCGKSGAVDERLVALKKLSFIYDSSFDYGKILESHAVSFRSDKSGSLVVEIADMLESTL